MSYFNNISFINIDKRREVCGLSRPRKSIYYSMEYLKSGSVFLVVNGRKRKLTGPVVFWMLPENTYQFIAANNKIIEHFWADFHGSRAKHMVKSINERIPSGMIKIKKTLEFETIFTNMVKIYKEHTISRRYEAVVGLERLAGIIYSSAFDKDSFKDSKYDFIIEIAEEMKLFPLKEFDFKKIARQNGISYHYFRKLFKYYNHIAPNDYLIACKMEYAAQLMKQEDVNIGELAEICGFDAVSSFSRMFKSKMGISPKSYQNAIKNR